MRRGLTRHPRERYNREALRKDGHKAYPTVSRYFEGLDDGLNSYPDCQAKASLYRALLQERPLSGDAVADLPAPLRTLVQEPAPVSSWIPEVHSHALMLAVYERRFETLEEFAQHAYDRQRSLFEGPLYAIALKVVTPQLLIKTAALRWRMFHRGMSFRAQELQRNRGFIVVEHPNGVYEAVIRRALCEAIRAVLELSTRRPATVTVAESSPRHAKLSVQWNLQ